MLTPDQVGAYFADDLGDERLASALCMFHSRFSTNTFPSWELAHPYRMISHNGEINTLRGNINWMRAREALFASDLYEPGDVEKLLPIIREGLSDTACLDNAVELLVRSGYGLAHAMMMLIPEAWENHETMSQAKKDFYAYHSCLMEPWDGPASIGFTDGKAIGAVLDRNGLRPSRYCVTKDGLVIMASEIGRARRPARGRRPQGPARAGQDVPGRHGAGPDRRRRGAEALGSPRPSPTASGSASTWSRWPSCPRRPHVPGPDHETLLHRQQAFGYTLEDLKYILGPMGNNGEEAIGSMGTDTPLAVLSDRAQPLFNYFKQLFAQVTNPPLDAIREELVTSVLTGAGGEGNLLEPDPRELPPDRPRHPDPRQRRAGPAQAARRLAGLQVGHPADALPRRRGGRGAGAGPRGRSSRRRPRRSRRGRTCSSSPTAASTPSYAPIPSLLACSGLHHHLVREGLRTRAGLIVECGDAREVHHFALLLGYGAGSINPYVAFETLDDMIRQGIIKPGIDHAEAVKRYRKAIKKGVVKVMSKMGISTIQSYRGAQIFEAIGLNEEFVARYFDKTASRIGGIGLEEIAGETLYHHHRAYADREVGPTLLDGGRPVPVAPRRRVPPVQPRDRLPAPARHPLGPLRHLQAVHPDGRRAERAALHAPRPLRLQGRRVASRSRSRRSSRSSRSSSGSPPGR